MHSGHEAGPCLVLCHLSQDSSGPDRGRPEDLRHHFEGRLLRFVGYLKWCVGGASQLIEAFHRWSTRQVSWGPMACSLENGIPEM